METTHNMSPWTLIAEASLLVQLVMLILVLASLISWFLIVQRSSLMGTARRSLSRFEQRFRSKNTDLQQLYQQQQPESPGVEGIFHAGYYEFAHLQCNLHPCAFLIFSLFAVPVSAGRVVAPEAYA